MKTINEGCGCGCGNAQTSCRTESATTESKQPQTAGIKPGLINRKVALLISAGAAMAGNCEPCLRTLVPQLKEARASDEEIRWAVLMGQRVKEQPISIMKAVADELTGTRLAQLPIDESCPADEMVKDDKYRITLLIAAAAAMAAHCEFCLNKVVPDLIEANVSETDIRRAVEIGQFVKDQPAAIMKEAADILTGTTLSRKVGASVDCTREAPDQGVSCCG
jgi:alkylhydroperoxidase/carboxymuconolactone decarboxylase family protein YurZ